MTTAILNTRIVRGRFALSGSLPNPSRGTDLSPTRFTTVILTIHRTRTTLNSNRGRLATDRTPGGTVTHGDVITTQRVGTNRIFARRGLAAGHPKSKVSPVH